MSKLQRRVQVFIGSQASEALDRIVERMFAGSQTVAIEAALIHYASALDSNGALDPTDPENQPGAHSIWRADAKQVDSSVDTKIATSFNGPSGVARKTAQKERKAVTAALPEPGEIIERIQQKIEERIGPAIKPEACMHPASQRRGSKCLECGGQWKTHL